LHTAGSTVAVPQSAISIFLSRIFGRLFRIETYACSFAVAGSGAKSVSV
jgi:hypothetical protein